MKPNVQSAYDTVVTQAADLAMKLTPGEYQEYLEELVGHFEMLLIALTEEQAE